MPDKINIGTHVTAAENDLTLMAVHRGMVGDGNIGCRSSGWYHGGSHAEAVGSGYADVTCQVGGIDGEALADACTLKRKRRYGGGQLGKGGRIGSRGIVGEVGHVAVQILETELSLGKTAHTGQSGIIDLEGTY